MHIPVTPEPLSPLGDTNADKLRRILLDLPIMVTAQEVDTIRTHQEANPTPKRVVPMNRHQRRRAQAKARRSK